MTNTKPEDTDINAKVIYNRVRKHSNFSDIKSILDIGAGKGNILNYINKITNFEKKLFAIEPSIECNLKLKNTNIKVIGSSFNDFDYRYLGKIDLIISRHVFEHLYNPMEAMQKITFFLKENGILYISVPNPFGESSIKEFGFPHISYFNIVTLKMLADKADLFVIDISEEKDEIYGIFKKGNESEKEIASEDNYKLTSDYIRNYYRISTTKNMKRLISYMIPTFLIKKYLLGMRN